MSDDLVQQPEVTEQMHVPLKMDTPLILSRKSTVSENCRYYVNGSCSRKVTELFSAAADCTCKPGSFK